MNERRIVGPPGTGKTTKIVQLAQDYLAAWRTRTGSAAMRPHAVLISSLTNAAAGEVRKRHLQIDPDMIGTLHKHGRRALDNPPLFVADPDCQHVSAWNSQNSTRPEWQITGARANTHDRLQGDCRLSGGDRLLEECHVLRAQLVPKHKWSNTLLCEFHDKLDQFKKMRGLYDFADLIDEAYKQSTKPPGSPELLLIDEAQDHSRAELRLVRHWAKSCDALVIVGDPDQNLFEWRGSEPEAFYAGKGVETEVLEQSYRVPRQVHEIAMRIIAQIQHRRSVKYNPRDAAGEVRHAVVQFSSLRHAHEMIDDAERRYLAHGKTVMFLASCEHMLRPLQAALREVGIPYWNPWSASRGAFNPLHRAHGETARDKLLAYFRPNEAIWGSESRPWTWGDVRRFTSLCGPRFLTRSGTATIPADGRTDPERPFSGRDIASSFTDQDAIAQMLDELERGQTDWPELLRYLRKGATGAVDYCLRIMRHGGSQALRQDPRVVVGTVHSVKGGEADVVYLCPDLSTAGSRSFAAAPDAVYRMFYVAVTRARETLVLCQPSSRRSFLVG